MHLPPTELLIPQPNLVLAQGAGHAGSLPRLLKRAGVALWRGLEAQGQARARRELRILADRWAHRDPELARQLRAASEFDVLMDTPATASESSCSTPADLAGTRV